MHLISMFVINELREHIYKMYETYDLLPFPISAKNIECMQHYNRVFELTSIFSHVNIDQLKAEYITRFIKEKQVLMQRYRSTKQHNFTLTDHTSFSQVDAESTELFMYNKNVNEVACNNQIITISNQGNKHLKEINNFDKSKQLNRKRKVCNLSNRIDDGHTDSHKININNIIREMKSQDISMKNGTDLDLDKEYKETISSQSINDVMIETNNIKNVKRRMKYNENSVEEKAAINKKRSEKRALKKQIANETIIEENRIKSEKQRLKYYEKSVEEKIKINKKLSERRALKKQNDIALTNEMEIDVQLVKCIEKPLPIYWHVASSS